MRCRLGYNLAISVINKRYIYQTSSILKTLSTIYSLFCTDKVNLKSTNLSLYALLRGSCTEHYD